MCDRVVKPEIEAEIFYRISRQCASQQFTKMKG